MLPATKVQCSIRISELLNSFQPWCYYLIWGRVTTCLPLTPNVSPSPLLNPFYDGQQMPINITHCSLRRSQHMDWGLSFFCWRLSILAERNVYMLTHRLDLALSAGSSLPHLLRREQTDVYFHAAANSITTINLHQIWAWALKFLVHAVDESSEKWEEE